MQVVTPKDKTPEKYSKAIFLAGPTPRESSVKSWRPDALEELRKQGYDGVVFVPETDFTKQDYTDQVEWEKEALDMSDCILFWVPRSEKMPAFTTNVEYGEWMKSGKVVLGYPEDAERMRYLETKAADYFVPVKKSLEEVVKAALGKVGKGSERSGGERYIPLMIWDTPSFKSWYDAVKKAGNKLERAEVLWSFRCGKKKEFVFCWVVHAHIYITKEKRSKVNEFVFSRTDVTSVVAYRKAGNLPESEVLIVKEFRTPCSNDTGYVYELPGGSSQDLTESATEVIAKELEEETGLKIKKDRFEYVQSRQMYATLSAHKAHIFRVELTSEEMERVERDAGNVHGVEEDSERTYVEVHKLRDILEKDIIDWSNLGILIKGFYDGEKETGKEASDWVGQFLG